MRETVYTVFIMAGMHIPTPLQSQSIVQSSIRVQRYSLHRARKMFHVNTFAFLITQNPTLAAPLYTISFEAQRLIECPKFCKIFASVGDWGHFGILFFASAGLTTVS